MADSMVCILLNNDDVSGLWLARCLQQLSAQTIKLISAEELMYAPSFTCGIHNGQTFFKINLQNGFEFTNKNSSTIINRIGYLPLQHLQQFKQEDSNYVQAELMATFVFLFSSFRNPVFNTASGRGLCGAERSAAEWAMLAGKAGFCSDEMLYEEKEMYIHQSAGSATTFLVVVFNNRCYLQTDHLPVVIEKSCLKLLQLSGENILEVYCHMESENVHFLSAALLPSFKNTNHNFIDELNKLLQ